MPRFVATVLSVVLCCEPLHVVISAEPSFGGPLARAVSREADRLAAGAIVVARDWENLQDLKPGQLIIITTSTATINGAFIGADSTTLIVQRGEATERLNADDVLVVSASKRRGSAGAAVFGTLGGIWLGSALAYGLAENARCYSGCAGVRLGVWGAIIGVPIAGGYGAWRLSSRLTEEVVYRRR
jgi:hypothetical protein